MNDNIALNGSVLIKVVLLVCLLAVIHSLNIRPIAKVSSLSLVSLLNPA